MRTILALLLAFASALSFADDAKKSDKKTEKKAKPAAKSDKNAAQKAEASIGKWANDNKIWITHPDKSGKK
jgi:hypothetical protein